MTNFLIISHHFPFAGIPPPMGMRPPGPPPGFMPLPMPYSAVLSKPPEISKQAEEGRPYNHCL